MAGRVGGGGGRASARGVTFERGKGKGGQRSDLDKRQLDTSPAAQAQVEGQLCEGAGRATGEPAENDTPCLASASWGRPRRRMHLAELLEVDPLELVQAGQAGVEGRHGEGVGDGWEREEEGGGGSRYGCWEAGGGKLLAERRDGPKHGGSSVARARSPPSRMGCRAAA